MTLRSWVGGVIVAGVCSVLLAQPALAGSPTEDSTGSEPAKGKQEKGGSQGNDVTAAVGTKIQVKQQGGGGKGQQNRQRGQVTAVDPNWQPPPCWYEPAMTPGQLKDRVQKAQKAAKGATAEGDLKPVQSDDSRAQVGSTDYWTAQQLTDHYKDGKAAKSYSAEGKTSVSDGYKNYNLGKDGTFWRGVANKGYDENRGDGSIFDCNKVMFWQDGKDTPKVENTVSPKVMAEYSYDKVKVPDTKVEMAPADNKLVNLPTWMWLDKGTFKPVKVRATLPGTGLWAETTAKPVSLRLDPGTEDADVLPASGECRIGKDGSIGKPYTRGHSEDTPPCGVTYRRASGADGSFPLKAKVTWEMSWKGSGGSGGKLPDGEFGTTQNVTVQERQTINK